MERLRSISLGTAARQHRRPSATTSIRFRRRSRRSARKSLRSRPHSVRHLRISEKKLENDLGNTIDPTAASIITNIQMASAIDTDTALPTTLATSFQTGVDFYITFQFELGNTNVGSQTPGYVVAEYYAESTLQDTSQPLVVDDSTYAYGYFPAQYDLSTTAGTIELYWCRVSSCSDKKLAGTATFTVS